MSASKPIPPNHPDASLLDWEKIIKNGNDHSSSAQFTRRHYIWLTERMRELYTTFPKDPQTIEFRYGIQRGIEIFAEALANDNPRFNKQQFLNNIFNPIKEEPHDR